MYGHQVIDFLEKKIKSFSPNIDKKALKSILIDMKCAQHFHTWPQAEFDKSAKHLIGTARIFLDECDDLLFPYPICWFDYAHSQEKSIKYGALVKFRKKEMEFDFVPFFKMKGNWHIDPLKLSIRIGKFYKGWDSNIWPTLLYETERVNRFNYENYYIEFLESPLTYLHLVLLFLNCKNIGTSNIFPSAKLSKKRRKKGKHPLFTYKVLVLKSTATKKQKSTPQDLWNNRLHLCRGHFKTYTKDNPLFGRITGRYWWQPHVRGDKKKGIIMKDYKVKN